METIGHHPRSKRPKLAEECFKLHEEWDDWWKSYDEKMKIEVGNVVQCRDGVGVLKKWDVSGEVAVQLEPSGTENTCSSEGSGPKGGRVTPKES